MTPYYSDEFVRLFHGDCREVTEWLGADVLITDPPYGRAWRQGEIKSRRNAVPHTRNLASVSGIAGDHDTNVRDTVLSLWGAERRAILFGDLILAPPSGTKLVGAYQKPSDAGTRGAMGGIRRDLEAIYLLGPWPSGIGGRSSLFATTASNVGGAHGLVARAGGHPHTKPQDVVQELIQLTDGVIADPCTGGGQHVGSRQGTGSLHHRRRARGALLRDRGEAAAPGHALRRCRMRALPNPEPGDRDRPPFSNSSMAEIWLANVCSAGAGCIHDSTYGQADDELPAKVDCPLITLSMMHIWPHEWAHTDRGPGACSQYTDELPMPKPEPVIAVDLFGEFNKEPV